MCVVIKRFDCKIRQEVLKNMQVTSCSVLILLFTFVHRSNGPCWLYSLTQGTLNNLTVEDNDTTLIVSWTTEDRDIPFQFIHVIYQQAFPDHSTNNHFITLTNSKLSVDGTKFTYRLDKKTLVPKFLGPLLFSVSASTQNSMYRSDEVLYTPSDNGE